MKFEAYHDSKRKTSQVFEAFQSECSEVSLILFYV